MGGTRTHLAVMLIVAIPLAIFAALVKLAIRHFIPSISHNGWDNVVLTISSVFISIFLLILFMVIFVAIVSSLTYLIAKPNKHLGEDDYYGCRTFDHHRSYDPEFLAQDPGTRKAMEQLRKDLEERNKERNNGQGKDDRT